MKEGAKLSEEPRGQLRGVGVGNVGDNGRKHSQVIIQYIIPLHGNGLQQLCNKI